MFQSQVKTAPRGYGRGETVTEIEVMSAERKARESGLRSDELVAKALRQRLEDQTRQGKAPGAAPKGTIGMMSPEVTMRIMKLPENATKMQKEMATKSTETLKKTYDMWSRQLLDPKLDRKTKEALNDKLSELNKIIRDREKE
jgi:hypothetical protein